jgi:hypothetical protein
LLAGLFDPAEFDEDLAMVAPLEDVPRGERTRLFEAAASSGRPIFQSITPWFPR